MAQASKATGAVLAIAAAFAAGAAHANAPDLPATATLSQPPAPGAQGVVVYTAADFAAARPGTAFDMILRLPGFSFDGGAQVRGFADAAGNVLIDGQRPTSKQDDLSEALKRIAADQVDRIEVIRGGAPGIDMQGRTVLANVVRRKGAGSAQGAVTLQDKVVTQDGRNLPKAVLEWTRRTDDHSLELALKTAGFVDDVSGDGPHTTRGADGAVDYAAHLWTQASARESTLTSAYEGPLAGGKLRINGLVQLDTYLDHEADTASLPTTNGDDVYKDASDTLKSELGAHFTRALGGKATLETLVLQQLSRTHEHSFYRADLGGAPDDEFYDVATVNAESIARATLRYQARPTLTLETALEGAYNTQGVATIYTINAIPQSLPAANEHVAETRGEAALSATWAASARYTLEAGLRLEASSVRATGDVQGSKTLFYPKPRIVLTWSPDPKDQLRLRLEREVGQLDFAAFSATGSLNTGGLHAGNPRVTPQQSWVAEAALERRFWKTGDATLTLRRLQISDAVDHIIGQAGGMAFDEGGNLKRGWENDLVADVTLPLDALGLKDAQLKASGTWSETQVTDPSTGQARPQSGIHPSTVEAHFTQDLTRWRSSWGVDFINGWTETDYRFDEVDVLRYGARFSVFFEYKPNPALSVRAEADNLFSQGWRHSVASYDTPRSVASRPDQLDIRDLQYGPLLSLRVRRALG